VLAAFYADFLRPATCLHQYKRKISMSFLTKIFGTRNDKILRQIQPLIVAINEKDAGMRALSDDGLRRKSAEFKERISRGESLDAILPEAYAVCREAGRRALGQRHYDVQLIGGIVLHQGKIAEMKTGEGKTLTATLPCYLHGLSGKGAHLVTVNDYLAKRDAEWMGQVYRFLGLSIGVICHGLSDNERQQAYDCDITYGTNNEFGFDYLRDNMKTEAARLVQKREHNFAIVDEVDSILIDEARTPLIISGPTDANTDLYVKVNSAIPGLQKDSDYIVDEKSRAVSLTEDGISKLEKRLRIDNLYNPEHIDWLHHCQQALKAHMVFKKDVDYVVKGGEVVIVDEFTGRLMPGRRYSDGLHGALEAKEHVPVQQETQTLATITFQNYFRLYKTLSGMTGTADTEAVEFKKIYNLDVVVIPTNRKLVRQDQQDMIFRTAREKYQAIAQDIKESQKNGQPVLVGTVSVEKSELLSHLLRNLQVPHEILNAKNHAREASIIENAGMKSHVTISTNMAGRGTDIKLGEGVADGGGLYVIGTERHESRRIDNQLRGRSGRQGDPGKTKFFLSLEDDLMRIFASDRLSAIMGRLGMEEGEAIVSPMVSRAIEKAQRRVEEQNFSSRKHVLEYDDVMSQQRQVIYKKRRQALLGSVDVDFIEDVVKDIIQQIAKKYDPEELDSEQWDLKRVGEELTRHFHTPCDLRNLDVENLSLDAIVDAGAEQILSKYAEKKAKVPAELMAKVENYIYLQVIDQAWKEHLLGMDALKDSVSLRGYGQRDPLQEYKKEAFTLFSQMMQRIEENTTMGLIHLPPPDDRFLAEHQEHDDELDGVSFVHPQAQSNLGGAPLSRQQQSSEEEQHMVYHGSRDEVAVEEPHTFRRESEKVGRNDPCPCGSGKKFKKCHGMS
jgi:preprotein translocase subunit SecA